MITKKENAQNARSTYMIRITVTLTVCFTFSGSVFFWGGFVSKLLAQCSFVGVKLALIHVIQS